MEQHQERLDPKLLEAVLGQRPGDAYAVGPGDTVFVAVLGHPELSISTYVSGGVRGDRLSGLVVDNDGTIQFPLIGGVQVAGKTVEEIRLFLEKELAMFLKDPQVIAQVAFASSIRYHLLGQFTDPGLKYSDRPLRLLEALSLAGSVDLEGASLHSAYVSRAQRKLPVDFAALLLHGDMRQNIWLRPGDVVFVPNRVNDQVFVFAGTQQNQGGPVQMPQTGLTITQALAAARFGYRDNFQGRLSEVRVIRSIGDRGEFYVVDVGRILDGEAAPFRLAPGDVVFVPAGAFTNWNLALEQLLPTLETVSTSLQPFVQIKFLQE